jgi:hypothetical protein
VVWRRTRTGAALRLRTDPRYIPASWLVFPNFGFGCGENIMLYSDSYPVWHTMAYRMAHCGIPYGTLWHTVRHTGAYRMAHCGIPYGTLWHTLWHTVAYRMAHCDISYGTLWHAVWHTMAYRMAHCGIPSCNMTSPVVPNLRSRLKSGSWGV